MDATLKGESSNSQSKPVEEVSGNNNKVPTSSTGLSISSGDHWFTQLPVVTSQNQFTGHNLYIWTRHVHAVPRPHNLIDHLIESTPLEIDSNYKRWIVEEEVLYIWILESMMAALTNRFIEYETVKYSDQSKITRLASRSCALQPGEKYVLAYTNELNAIYKELDHYRPPVHDSVG